MSTYDPDRVRKLLRRRQLKRLGVCRADMIVDTVPLAELRHARGLTQEAVAAALLVGQSQVSKLESRTDVRVSSLQRYVAALGGELELIVRFPDGARRVQLTSDPPLRADP